jgi:regulator of sigma E protease
MVIRSLTGLLTGRFGFNDLSGPVGIVKMVGDEYESAAEETDVSVSKNLWVSLISMLVMISVNLGIMNIIPLPALDGGHLLFLFIELIRRKPVSPKVEARIHQVGFSLLMIFSCIIIMKDMFQYFI